MVKRGDSFKADKGKVFVVTEKGRKEVRSFSGYATGEQVDTYVPCWEVDKGYVEEIPDPDWVVIPGWKAVYYSGVYQFSVGNPQVFHDREMAEMIIKKYQSYDWFNEECFVVPAIYEGKAPKPCRTYNGKVVYNHDYWMFGRPPGSLVEEEVVDDLMDSVPPACMRSSCMQIGEPANHIDGKPVYETFKKVADGIYEYCGQCFRGMNKEV